MFGDNIWLWVVFNLFILGMLALDLGMFHRDSHEIKTREAITWSVIWTLIALAFNAGVFFVSGPTKGLEFFTGYLIERALSIDNIFVFILVFAYFGVAPKYQYKVLFWGILGALVMRAAMIFLGTALIETFHWVIYVFGALLVISAIKMAFQNDEEVHPERNPLVRLFRRVMPVTAQHHADKLFVRLDGKLFATPLFLVLLVIETTDLLFAIDSIPAIFAVTTDPFIVYSSNVFAILGMRALYFALAGIMDRFHYLKVGLSVVLAFVGTKMLISDLFDIPTVASLGVIALILGVSVVASLLRPREKESEPEAERGPAPLQEF